MSGLTSVVSSRFTRRMKSHHIGKDMQCFISKPQRLVDLLDSDGDTDQVIYIHVPYCSNICTFCNMNRTMAQPNPHYADYILEQIKHYAQTRRFTTSTFDSVYFGGGTPSVLSADDINRILDLLHESAHLSPTVEISIETSLTDLGVAKLRSLQEHGVNRLSIGIQTFSDRGRQLLGRRGNGDFARRQLCELMSEGFRAINIDLIYNYLDETIEELDADLRTIQELDIAGFSFYSLMVMHDSLLGRQYKRLGHAVTDDAKDYTFFSRIIETSDPFRFLELTKLAQPGRDEYRYIRRRLACKDTFALGAGAGGTIASGIMMNPVRVQEFVQKNIHGFDDVMCMTMSSEYIRYKKALNTLQLLFFDPQTLIDERGELAETVMSYFNELCNEGYAVLDGSIYRLTKTGAFWGNNIVSDLWKIIVQNVS